MQLISKRKLSLTVKSNKACFVIGVCDVMKTRSTEAIVVLVEMDFTSSTSDWGRGSPLPQSVNPPGHHQPTHDR